MGFRSHLRAEVVPDDAAYLFSDRGVTALQGDHVEALVPLLDGTRDLSAVLRDAAPEIPPEHVGRLIGKLARAGLVGYSTPVTDGGSDGHAQGPARAYWELAGLDGTEAQRQLAAAELEVLAVGGASTAGVLEACRGSGLAVAPRGGAHDAHRTAGADHPVGEDTVRLSLVVCDDYLNPGLREIDALHRATGRPWLLARPGGSTAWIGPVFQPGSGPCWSCLAHRLRGHRQSEAPVRRALGLAGPVPRPAAQVPPTAAAAAQLIALEATKWLAGYRHPGQSAVLTLDTLSLTTRHHELVRRPQCPDCGDPGLVARQVGQPVTIVSRPKAGDGRRACSPQEVRDRYLPLVSPVTGVIEEIRRDPRAPAGLHCYLAGRNPALGGTDLARLRAGLRQLSGGKGATALDAEVSAMCEALERYSGTLQGDEPRIRDSLRGLGDAAVSPDDCQLFATRQFRDRERWNAQHDACQYVPDRFDERAPVDWTPVWSLTGQRQRLLPTGMLYFPGASEGSSPVAGRRSLRADSNGNAAGSSPEDAILHGFLELVERDAVALWWYNRTRQPGVRLDGPGGFGDGWTEALIGVYRRLNREVWALDLTSDLGIPVFAAVSRRTGGSAEDIVFGFGAHFDPAIALRRALTEMNQLLPAVPDARSDGTGHHGSTAPEPLGWWRGATVRTQPYLLPDPSRAAREVADFDFHDRPDLRDDIEAVVALLRGRGMELLVLDQTRPDLGIPVVKVVVPGLRHFWARFAPGRLFDVPVRLGRLSAPTAYDGLNPVPLFV